MEATPGAATALVLNCIATIRDLQNFRLALLSRVRLLETVSAGPMPSMDDANTIRERLRKLRVEDEDLISEGERQRLAVDAEPDQQSQTGEKGVDK